MPSSSASDCSPLPTGRTTARCPEPPDHAMNPMRGIGIGVLLALPLWGLIGMGLWLVLC